MRVMDQIVHVAAEYFVGVEADQFGAGTIDEDAAAALVDAVDAFAGRLQQHFELMPPGSVMRQVVEVGEHGARTMKRCGSPASSVPKGVAAAFHAPARVCL
jgi:hypothetical protein